MKRDMKRVETSVKIDLSEWSFGFGSIDAFVSDGVAKAIEEALDENPPCLSFPIYWASTESDGDHGPAVTDPATIYLRLPFGKYGDEGYLWSVSLEDVIDEEFGISEPRDEDYGISDEARALANRLREIADKLEKQDH